MNETFKEKLKNFSKKISIFTTVPRVDWQRIFIGLSVCMLAGIIFSVLFFFEAEKSVSATVKDDPQKSRIDAGSVHDKEVLKIIDNFAIRAKKNAAFLGGTIRIYAPVEPPATTTPAKVE